VSTEKNIRASFLPILSMYRRVRVYRRGNAVEHKLDVPESRKMPNEIDDLLLAEIVKKSGGDAMIGLSAAPPIASIQA
jgi:hypothetical protein